MTRAPEQTGSTKPLGFLDEALDQMRSEGLYRQLRVLEGEQKPHARFDGQQIDRHHRLLDGDVVELHA